MKFQIAGFLALSMFYANPLVANTQNIISTTLIDGQFTCHGSEVIITCQTRGSRGLGWKSEDYIGIGNVQINLFPNVTTMGSSLSATALLTREYIDGGELVLESTLQIIASSNFPTSSVTCVNVDNNRVAVVNFAILADPGELREPSAVQMRRCKNSSGCVINTLWRPPLNAVAAKVKNYIIRVNGTNPELVPTFDIIDNGTRISSLLSVSSCATHGVSVSTLNDCGEGPITFYSTLKPMEIVIIPNSSCVNGGTNINGGPDITQPPDITPRPASDIPPTTVIMVVLAVVSIVLVVIIVLLMLYIYKLKKHAHECGTGDIGKKNSPLPPTDNERKDSQL